MTDVPDSTPCQTCGSPIRVRHDRGERSITDTVTPVIRTRVCTNGSCPTNTGEKSLADVV